MCSQASLHTVTDPRPLGPGATKYDPSGAIFGPGGVFFRSGGPFIRSLGFCQKPKKLKKFVLRWPDIPFSILSGVNFWVIIWISRVEVTRTAGAKTHGEQDKTAAVFTHFLTQKYIPLSILTLDIPLSWRLWSAFPGSYHLVLQKAGSESRRIIFSRFSPLHWISDFELDFDNGKHSNSWYHFWECHHLLFFKEGKFGVVWALGGSNSN